MHASNIPIPNRLDLLRSRPGKTLSNETLTVEISNQQSIELDEDPLLSVVRKIATENGVQAGEISIAIVDDAAIHDLNRKYLEHDYETDVLSFVLEENVDNKFLIGQLIISAETARTNARELNIATQHEIMLYAVHGTLHLVGFDDHETEDVAAMRAAEKKYLAEFGIEPHWENDDEGTSLYAEDDDWRQADS